jgi:hypothetical protein
MHYVQGNFQVCENLGLADWRAPPKTCPELVEGMGKDKKYQEPEYEEYFN